MNSNTTNVEVKEVQNYFQKEGICLLKEMDWAEAQFSLEEQFASKGGFCLYDKHSQKWSPVTNAKELEDMKVFYEQLEKDRVAEHIRIMG